MKKFSIKKGYNIKLDGNPSASIVNQPDSDFIKYHPSDIKSFKTKLLVKVGDHVNVGTPLFFDKKNEEVIFVSSVSGKIEKIELGARRIVEKIIIQNDKKYKSVPFLEKETKETLLKSGLWSLLRQKPFSKIPHFDSVPKSIFISAMPTEPFAVNNEFLFSEIDNYLQSGIDIMKKIFNCDINISIESKSSFKNLKNVNFFTFNKLHPSGNVGIQIHHIDPIKNGTDIRWYLSMQNLNTIGYYFSEKKINSYKYISIGGNAFDNPAYYKILAGTPVIDIIKKTSENTRYISGDVLSGTEIDSECSMNLNDEVLSVIKTDSKQHFLGWLMPGLKKYSLSNAFFSKFISNRKSILDTKLNGSTRSIIPMGNWDKVLPMNIYSEFLIKSIIAKDIDMMEKLGIYESSPEDFSLCSFVCQSKVEVSSLIEDGLNLIESEV